MGKKNRRVRAKVQVLMEVEADSVWGGDTSWDQIAKQAEDGVHGLLMNGNALALKDLPQRIISLKMISVTVKEEASS